MRAVVTTAVTRFVPEKRQRVRGAQLLGLLLASIIPAAIWCVLISSVAFWIGEPISIQTTFIIGVVIALFLAIVCAPLILRDRD